MCHAGSVLIEVDRRELLDRLRDLTRPRGSGPCKVVASNPAGDGEAARAYLDHFWKVDAWLQALCRPLSPTTAHEPE